MKKYKKYFLAAAVLMALTACSQSTSSMIVSFSSEIPSSSEWEPSSSSEEPSSSEELPTTPKFTKAYGFKGKYQYTWDFFANAQAGIGDYQMSVTQGNSVSVKGNCVYYDELGDSTVNCVGSASSKECNFTVVNEGDFASNEFNQNCHLILNDKDKTFTLSYDAFTWSTVSGGKTYSAPVDACSTSGTYELGDNDYINVKFTGPDPTPYPSTQTPKFTVSPNVNSTTGTMDLRILIRLKPSDGSNYSCPTYLTYTVK